MPKKSHSIIRDISNNYDYMIKLVVTTVVLAFGINLISSQLVASANFPPVIAISLGIFLCITSLIYLFLKLYHGSSKNHEIDAFFEYDCKENKLVKVSRYDFSERIYEYFEDAFIENSALEKQWKRDPLSAFHVCDDDLNQYNKSGKLIVEAAQYYLLTQLSVHLTDYFADKDLTKHNLKEYGRLDIPEFLLKNRFLDLFSRPMDDRPAFTDEDEVKDENESEFEGEIVSAYNGIGAYYNKFELVLPEKSKFTKPTDSKIEIDTEKLKISMETRFNGYGTLLPRGFKKYYLGVDDLFRFHTYKLEIDINIDMKLRSLFSRAGWEYYYWIDSFLDEIESQVSSEVFFKQINWESTLTNIQCQEIKNKKDCEIISKDSDESA